MHSKFILIQTVCNGNIRMNSGESFLPKINPFHVNKKLDQLNVVSLFPEHFLHLWKSPFFEGLYWAYNGLRSEVSSIGLHPLWNGHMASHWVFHLFIQSVVTAGAFAGGLCPWRAYSLLGDIDFRQYKYKLWSLLSVILGATQKNSVIVTVTFLNRREYFKLLYPSPCPIFFPLELLQLFHLLSDPLSTLPYNACHRMCTEYMTLASCWVQLKGA